MSNKTNRQLEAQVEQVRTEKLIPCVFNLTESRLKEFVSDVLKEESTNQSVAERWLCPALEYVPSFVAVQFAEKLIMVGNELFEKTKQFIQNDKKLINEWSKYLGITQNLKTPVQESYTFAELLMLVQSRGAIVDAHFEVSLIDCVVEKKPELKEELDKLLKTDLQHIESIKPYINSSTAACQNKHYMYNIDREELDSLITWIKKDSPEFELIKAVVLPIIDQFDCSNCIVHVKNDTKEEFQEMDYALYLALKLFNPMFSLHKLFGKEWYSIKEGHFNDLVTLITIDPFEALCYKISIEDDGESSFADLFTNENIVGQVINTTKIATHIFKSMNEHCKDTDIMEYLYDQLSEKAIERIFMKIEQLKIGETLAEEEEKWSDDDDDNENEDEDEDEDVEAEEEEEEEKEEIKPISKQQKRKQLSLATAEQIMKKNKN